MVAWLLVAHVFGWTFWVSGLLATSIALSRHAREAAPAARESLAGVERAFLRGMADPGALVAILAGIGLIETNPSYYLRAGWLHIKFVFVAILIILHVVIAIRSKRLSRGSIQLRSGQTTVLLAAVAVVFLLILIATLPGAVFLR